MAVLAWTLTFEAQFCFLSNLSADGRLWDFKLCTDSKEHFETLSLVLHLIPYSLLPTLETVGLLLVFQQAARSTELRSQARFRFG
jgi:hypothetical protein